MSHPEKNTAIIKNTARQLGFSYCGIAKAEQLDNDARRLEQWLSQGMHGGMQYMENHFDLRVDPRKLVPGAKSVITLLQNYFPGEQQSEAAPHIAKYAFGKDYHEVIRAKLRHFLSVLNEEIGEIQGRGFVDSAPVLERTWAVKSGAGWVGKNGNLINKQSGSFYFIATLIVDIELLYDDSFAKDFCGSCRKCIDACPTDAILNNKIVDGSKCISYYTIELKDALIPDALKGKFNNWMFGCDVCQDVCPWNRFSKPHNEMQFAPIPEILDLSTKEWEEMTEETFRSVFKHSPLKRAKFEGIKRNLSFISQ
ncbi:tRNA epoxyqueuosine(34) reductase QueG [Sediminibacterium roseum]|uniref:Epoxyqueuosine reductase n=1 Tax=Sediminibacterium roseum TaxID=1978412 RepID=A0ABW9ZUJ2_9BACT|nr:tRNA epoxyqueuosine(34) reductase QueG [Sediminibacterium roseum]NCI50679.1 tRNA epoxyqueuosine(34) reductase QueG [Sediminibacterium roseum]